MAVAVGRAVGAGVQAARKATIRMKDKMRLVVFMVGLSGGSGFLGSRLHGWDFLLQKLYLKTSKKQWGVISPLDKSRLSISAVSRYRGQANK